MWFLLSTYSVFCTGLILTCLTSLALTLECLIKNGRYDSFGNSFSEGGNSSAVLFINLHCNCDISFFFFFFCSAHFSRKVPCLCFLFRDKKNLNKYHQTQLGQFGDCIFWSILSNFNQFSVCQLSVCLS